MDGRIRLSANFYFYVNKNCLRAITYTISYYAPFLMCSNILSMLVVVLFTTLNLNSNWKYLTLALKLVVHNHLSRIFLLMSGLI